MAILLLFNSSDQLPYRDIVAATKLPQETLDPSLDKLVKSRVLSRQSVPDTGDVKFSINYGFKSNKVKNNLIVTIKSKKRKEIECGRKADMEHRRMQTQVMENLTSSLNKG
ncbi:hypothetical protein M1821_008232 [Neofusicoccum parvum]|uniref:Uncharacterized protein n=1 Tax=Neofusicoccum parvum TaxID=310453 RepID=A0ACB5SDT6_9PEZI|nr:hypothetical protein M1821_008232 [Neofusicoccum parvum]